MIATPGTESNVKEIFDKCWELRRSGEDLMIFNQFEEFGNHLWHYDVTGHAMEEVLQQVLRPGETLRGSIFTTGSAGTIGAGDYLKEAFPESKLGASEALQCPTLLLNGFGAHRIEGIGDKHVPWIHNVKNTDLITAIDDEAPIQMIRLFNEPEGQKYLAGMGVPAGADRRAAPVGHLRRGQRAVGDQDGQVVRVGRGRRGDDGARPTRWSCTAAACASSTRNAASSRRATRRSPITST